MTAEIVHDDDVSALQDGKKQLLDIGTRKHDPLIGSSKMQGAVSPSQSRASRKVRVCYRP